MRPMLTALAVLPALVLLAATSTRPRRLAAPAPLRLVGTIPLPGVEGRIDHMAADVRGGRLFVCALGNNTLEALDLRAGRPVHTVRGLHEPQGCAYVPNASGASRLFVANGEGEGCDVYDGRTFSLVKRVPLGEDSDNVRFDPRADQVVVGYGGGRGAALAFLDARTGQEAFRVPLHGHPESFQLAADGWRVYVNVPDAGHIAVVNRERRGVVARWPVTAARANFPMALDEAHRRLFVGCRRPARLLVYDTDSGKVVAEREIAGDADDVFYDASAKRVYVSGGEGAVTVLSQTDADHYAEVARVPTAPGARTSLFVPALRRLYVAVPHRGAQRAEVRVYAAEP